MAKKKVVTFSKLSEYDTLLKNLVAENYSKILALANQHTNDQVTNITNGTTTVGKAADSNKLGGQLPSYYAKASDIPTGALAKLNQVSESVLDDGLSQAINSLVLSKHGHANQEVLDGITSTKVSNWDNSEANAKKYTDDKIALIMENPSEAVDSIVELKNAMNANGDLIESLNNIAASKVPTSRKINGKALSSDITLSASDVGAAYDNHTHSTEQITGLQSVISDITSTQTSNINRIVALEGKVGDGFEEVTSEEIQSLFTV